MKKAGISILAILYFAVSSGMIVNIHYCMNRFASADFSLAQSKQQCGSCGMHKTAAHGCCHDEVKFVKIQDDQQQTSVINFGADAIQPPVVIATHHLNTPFVNSDIIHPRITPSPPFLRQDIQVQLSIFRI